MRQIKPDLKEQHNKYINYNMAALPVGLPFNAYACKTAAGQIHHSGYKLTSRRSGKITGGSIYGLATCS